MLADKLRAATAARALPVFVSSSVQRVSSATSVTVTAPTGIQNGDLLVAVLVANDDRGEKTLPSGFVRVADSNSATQPGTLVVATKVAASESGNYTFTLAGSTTNITAAVLVYRNATRVNTIGSETRATTNTPTASSITPTLRGTLLAVFGCNNGVGAPTPPSGMAQRVYFGANSPTLIVYDQSPQETTSTGSKSITSGSNPWISILLQITNESTVAPEFVASASTQNGSSGTTLTINKPTGTVEGDLMVAVCAGGFMGSNNYTFPSGWTEAADLGSANGLSVAYKVAGASEPTNYTINATNNNTHAGSILTYRYAAYDTIGTFATGANPLILPSISPSESQSILIAAGARDVVFITLGTPTGMTARVTDANATKPSYIVCDQTVAKGPTGTRSMSTGSTTNVAGILLSIKPTRSLS